MIGVWSKLNELSFYLTLHHCLLCSPIVLTSGQPPAATPGTDLAIDDDCISEISDCFDEEKSENVLYQNLKMF